jgi:hypothetical protein
MCHIIMMLFVWVAVFLEQIFLFSYKCGNEIKANLGFHFLLIFLYTCI